MKKILILSIILVFTVLLVAFSFAPKSEINFTLKLIDGSPQTLPFAETTHTYPLKYATMVRGAYGGFEFEFEMPPVEVKEKPKTTVTYKFMFDLPDIKKFGIKIGYLNDKKEYVRKIKETPLTLTEKDYENLPKSFRGHDVYASIYVFKDTRTNVIKNGAETVESVNVSAPFDKFTLTIYSYEIKDNKLYMSASFKGKTVEDKWGWYPHKYSVEADFNIAGAPFMYKMVD